MLLTITDNEENILRNSDGTITLKVKYAHIDLAYRPFRRKYMPVAETYLNFSLLHIG